MSLTPSHTVAEIQGLYGPFSFSEKLLQKIWAEGDFDQSRLVTSDGQVVRLDDRGKWNRLAGPDFLRAKIRFGDASSRTCDVELHLRAEDWAAHGHANDQAYADVGLHVVLFPPRAGHRTLDGGGRAIPTVSLLPLLRHDLEEYAAEEAVETLANQKHGHLRDEVLRLPPAALRGRLMEFAEKRWRQKVHFAGQRVAKLGFTEACHQTALETLGYRFNRVPMLNLATRHPLRAWETGLEIEGLLREESANWARGGVRPANQPRRRLTQYRAWVAARADWPARWRAMAASWPTPAMTADISKTRRELWVRALREEVAEGLCAGAVGGNRLDTLICDGLVPLIAAESGRDLAGLWWHWWPGDLPGFLALARPEVRSVISPACQGSIQGLIGWALALESASL